MSSLIFGRTCVDEAGDVYFETRKGNKYVFDPRTPSAFWGKCKSLQPGWEGMGCSQLILDKLKDSRIDYIDRLRLSFETLYAELSTSNCKVPSIGSACKVKSDQCVTDSETRHCHSTQLGDLILQSLKFKLQENAFWCRSISYIDRTIEGITPVVRLQSDPSRAYDGITSLYSTEHLNCGWVLRFQKEKEEIKTRVVADMEAKLSRSKQFRTVAVR